MTDELVNLPLIIQLFKELIEKGYYVLFGFLLQVLKIINYGIE